MDPAAPNNNNPQNPQTPVQPGQFVVAGEDVQPQAQAQAQPPASTQPSVSLAGERPPDALPQTPMAAASGAAQPDPTPFKPPGAPPNGVSTGQASVTPPASGGGGKKIILIFAIIILLAIIAAVGYLFVMPMLNGDQSTPVQDEQIVETSPPIVRDEADPGFGELPESTTETELPPAEETTTENQAVDPLLTPAQ